jgi:hypothetical protein
MSDLKKYRNSIGKFALYHTMKHLQYPIGEFEAKEFYSDAERRNAIKILEHFPQWLDVIIQNRDEADYLKVYRPHGWTAAQVIHHCADSHMNCLMRLKLALTEENPTIKPYAENKWALLTDYHLPVNNSTTLLHAVHRKLVVLFQNLLPHEWSRTYLHPEHQKIFTIDQLLSFYAWHCEHHFAHLKIAWED